MKGLGCIQRRIRLAFVGHPDREFYTADLGKYAYPLHKGPLERSQRWTICRAAERVGYRVRRDWPGGVVWVGKPVVRRAVSQRPPDRSPELH